MLVVQCDFDNTITVGNVGTAIRTVFGPDDWRRMEEDYLAGRCSLEESNIRQYARLQASQKDLSEFVLTQVVVRDGFEGFVGYCQSQGIRLVVVSSGLDLYVRPTMKRLGLDLLEVYSASACVTQSGIQVEYHGPSGTVITRGFKESFVRDFKERGHTVIYVGDGLSDITPATEADFVIARSTLEQHLTSHGLPCYDFCTFEDVTCRVEEIRRVLDE